MNWLAESSFGNIGKHKNPVVAAFNYQSPKSEISSPYINIFNASRNIEHIKEVMHWIEELINEEMLLGLEVRSISQLDFAFFEVAFEFCNSSRSLLK